MGYSENQAKTFIATIAPLMALEAKSRGYKIVSTAIAQAIIEGAAGTSVLAKNYHNHFGLKCGSSWKGNSVNLKTKEEYTVGTLTTIKDNFRAYADDKEGVKGYYDFIATKRYANLKTATSYREYAVNLKNDGYATSSTYVNTLCKTVEKYGLYAYDSTLINKEATASIDEVAKEVIDGKYGSGETRKKLLTNAGYDYKEVQKRVNEILKGE